MRALIVRDDVQLRRLEDSLAAFKARSPAERNRMGLLIAALEREKAAVLSSTRGAHRRQSALFSPRG